MRKLFIVILALTSTSVFAGECSYKLTGNLNTDNSVFAKKLLKDKGYSTNFDMNNINYIIDAEAVEGQTYFGEQIKWVKFTIIDQDGEVLNFGEALTSIDGFRSLYAKSYRGLIKEAISQLPECK